MVEEKDLRLIATKWRGALDIKNCGNEAAEQDGQRGAPSVDATLEHLGLVNETDTRRRNLA